MTKKSSNLHPRNKHKGTYNFDELTKVHPELAQFVRPNKFKVDSIEFSNPKAVKALNKALLKSYYGLDYWEIPEGYLVPPIPGRADYIHNIADLLEGKKGKDVKVLDLGTGSSMIYAIIGNQEYDWSFIAADIDEIALNSAQRIVDNNKGIQNVELRFQKNERDTFLGIINSKEKIDVSICNPPFHASLEEAERGTKRKIKNLNKGKKKQKFELNFGGQRSELWTEGGEKKFIFNMIKQSIRFAPNVKWFTTLVSKEAIVPAILSSLRSNNAKEFKVIEMGQGNKVSRIVAWRF